MAKQHQNRGGRPSAQREAARATLEAMLARAQQAPLDREGYETLRSAVDTLALMTQALAAKDASIVRLRWLMFGERTEKTSRIFPDKEFESGAAPADLAAEQEAPAATVPTSETPKAKRPGHWRNGSGAYTGAAKVGVPHQSLARGQCCPE